MGCCKYNSKHLKLKYQHSDILIYGIYNYIFKLQMSRIRHFVTGSSAISFAIASKTVLQCTSNSEDFERSLAIQKIADSRIKHKNFLDTHADIHRMISEYEKTDCIVIPKKFSECRDDIQILAKLGIPLSSIKILQPKDNGQTNAISSAKSTGATVGMVTTGAVSYVMAIFSLGMVGLPFVICSSLLGGAVGAASGKAIAEYAESKDNVLPYFELDKLYPEQCEELK